VAKTGKEVPAFIQILRDGRMNAIHVHFTFLKDAPLKDYERTLITLIKEELLPEIENRRVVCTESPGEADIVVMLESGLFKPRAYLQTLSRDVNIRKHWQKVFTINYEDHPQGFLQGLYTSICHPNYQTALHRVWPPLFVPCDHVYQVTDERIHAQKPQYLFSFLGSKSHPIRQQILSLYSSHDANDVCVEDVDKWFNHSGSEKSKYVDVSLNSRFVLCPRGYAPFTFRICEAMALGRVPVVLADDWIPFSFEDRLPYYLKIPEAQVDQIPALLREADSKAEEYGFNARKLWNKYCSPKTRVNAALAEITKLKNEQTGPKTYGECKSQWNSRRVLKQKGWTFEQRLSRRLQNLITGFRAQSITPSNPRK
jgi:hypothetical protein